MSIASMTGFSREAGVSGPFQWVWELRSVNGRGLEVRFRTPPGYEAFGEEARKGIQQAMSRGQCQLNLSLSRNAAPPNVRINTEVLQSLLDEIGKLDLPSGMDGASLDGLLSVKGVIELEENLDTHAEEDLAMDLRAGLARLIPALVQARASEGAALQGVLSGHLETIRRLVDQAEDAPGRQPEAIRERLQAQIELLLGGKSGFDENRLHQEALVMAARADIREELDRLKAHIDSAEALLREDGAVGRKLDFLSQEFGREANTLCAKANDITLSRIGLELKAVIEQFREQVQNVE